MEARLGANYALSAVLLSLPPFEMVWKPIMNTLNGSKENWKYCALLIVCVWPCSIAIPSLILLHGHGKNVIPNWWRTQPCVDNLLTMGRSTNEVQHQKESAIGMLSDARFQLLKCKSNVKQFEEDNETEEDTGEQPFTKQQLIVQTRESKMLG